MKLFSLPLPAAAASSHLLNSHDASANGDSVAISALITVRLRAHSAVLTWDLYGTATFSQDVTHLQFGHEKVTLSLLTRLRLKLGRAHGGLRGEDLATVRGDGHARNPTRGLGGQEDGQTGHVELVAVATDGNELLELLQRCARGHGDATGHLGRHEARGNGVHEDVAAVRAARELGGERAREVVHGSLGHVVGRRRDVLRAQTGDRANVNHARSIWRRGSGIQKRQKLTHEEERGLDVHAKDLVPH